MERVDAIVLAAGGSTRLGRPKALLPLEGRPLLARVLATLLDAGVAQGMVVLGEDAGEISGAVELAPFLARRNPRPSAGRLGSVHVGLAGVRPAAGALVWPIDRPFASAATVRALVAAAGDSGGDVGWIVPSFDAGRGHPIFLCPGVLAKVRAAPPAASLREVLAASGTSRREVAVEDAGIHVNVDTEEDWRRALAWWAARSPAS